MFSRDYDYYTLENYFRSRTERSCWSPTQTLTHVGSKIPEQGLRYDALLDLFVKKNAAIERNKNKK